MNTTHRIFVYGTLRVDQGNYHAMGLDTQQYLGRARTSKPAYTMHANFAFPMVAPDGKGYVYGDVFMVDTPTLNALDNLEGVPHLYTREKHLVNFEDDSSVLAWMYLISPISLDIGTNIIIPSGNWLDFVRMRSAYAKRVATGIMRAIGDADE